MLELIAGSIVAAAVVALVLEPLVRRTSVTTQPDDFDMDIVELEEMDSPKIRALLALREIEFDKATGKLSDEDYGRLKSQYAGEALEAIAVEEREQEVQGVSASGEDPAEHAVASRRSGEKRECPTCGVRPEPGAVFCSQCGRSLLMATSQPRCWVCGAPLDSAARFCGACGLPLSA
jgi:Double zinc ribbon